MPFFDLQNVPRSSPICPIIQVPICPIRSSPNYPVLL
nr:MAG TPA: hypothetical protein [Caudoviricetes sp.]